MTDIATVLADAQALQTVVSTARSELDRSYGNIAAGKVNKIGAGLAGIVAGLTELAEAPPPAPPPLAEEDAPRRLPRGTRKREEDPDGDR